MATIKIIKRTVVGFVFAILILSCSDDFLDVASFDQDSENFFNSEEDYQSALIAAYDLLHATYINVMLGEIASNNTLAGGESATDVPGIQEIDDMVHTPVNQQLRDIWSWMYAGVNRTNFNRTPVAEVYAQIEQDLAFAVANLPEVQTDIGRATRGAAQSLLGKAFLYQNKFEEAATILEQVINSGTYDLLEEYDTMFENDNENNIESVFEVQYTDLEGAGFGCLQCSEGNVAVGFNGIRNYSGPLFESGFSFNVPTQEVFDAFEPGDIRRDVALLDIETFAQQNQCEIVLFWVMCPYLGLP